MFQKSRVQFKELLDAVDRNLNKDEVGVHQTQQVASEKKHIERQRIASRSRMAINNYMDRSGGFKFFSVVNEEMDADFMRIAGIDKLIGDDSSVNFQFPLNDSPAATPSKMDILLKQHQSIETSMTRSGRVRVDMRRRMNRIREEEGDEFDTNQVAEYNMERNKDISSLFGQSANSNDLDFKKKKKRGKVKSLVANGGGLSALKTGGKELLLDTRDHALIKPRSLERMNKEHRDLHIDPLNTGVNIVKLQRHCLGMNGRRTNARPHIVYLFNNARIQKSLRGDMNKIRERHKDTKKFLHAIGAELIKLEFDHMQRERESARQRRRQRREEKKIQWLKLQEGINSRLNAHKSSNVKSFDPSSSINLKSNANNDPMDSASANPSLFSSNKPKTALDFLLNFDPEASLRSFDTTAINSTRNSWRKYGSNLRIQLGSEEALDLSPASPLLLHHEDYFKSETQPESPNPIVAFDAFSTSHNALSDDFTSLDLSHARNKLCLTNDNSNEDTTNPKPESEHEDEWLTEPYLVLPDGRLLPASDGFSYEKVPPPSNLMRLLGSVSIKPRKSIPIAKLLSHFDSSSSTSSSSEEEDGNGYNTDRDNLFQQTQNLDENGKSSKAIFKLKPFANMHPDMKDISVLQQPITSNSMSDALTSARSTWSPRRSMDSPVSEDRMQFGMASKSRKESSYLPGLGSRAIFNEADAIWSDLQTKILNAGGDDTNWWVRLAKRKTKRQFTGALYGYIIGQNKIRRSMLMKLFDGDGAKVDAHLEKERNLKLEFINKEKYKQWKVSTMHQSKRSKAATTKALEHYLSFAIWNASLESLLRRKINWLAHDSLDMIVNPLSSKMLQEMKRRQLKSVSNHKAKLESGRLNIRKLYPFMEAEQEKKKKEEETGKTLHLDDIVQWQISDGLNRGIQEQKNIKKLEYERNLMFKDISDEKNDADRANDSSSFAIRLFNFDFDKFLEALAERKRRFDLHVETRKNFLNYHHRDKHNNYFNNNQSSPSSSAAADTPTLPSTASRISNVISNMENKTAAQVAEEIKIAKGPTIRPPAQEDTELLNLAKGHFFEGWMAILTAAGAAQQINTAFQLEKSQRSKCVPHELFFTHINKVAIRNSLIVTLKRLTNARKKIDVWSKVIRFLRPWFRRRIKMRSANMMMMMIKRPQIIKLFRSSMKKYVRAAKIIQRIAKEWLHYRSAVSQLKFSVPFSQAEHNWWIEGAVKLVDRMKHLVSIDITGNKLLRFLDVTTRGQATKIVEGTDQVLSVALVSNFNKKKSGKVQIQTAGNASNSTPHRDAAQEMDDLNMLSDEEFRFDKDEENSSSDEEKFDAVLSSSKTKTKRKVRMSLKINNLMDDYEDTKVLSTSLQDSQILTEPKRPKIVSVQPLSPIVNQLAFVLGGLVPSIITIALSVEGASLQNSPLLSGVDWLNISKNATVEMQGDPKMSNKQKNDRFLSLIDSEAQEFNKDTSAKQFEMLKDSRRSILRDSVRMRSILKAFWRSLTKLKLHDFQSLARTAGIGYHSREMSSASAKSAWNRRRSTHGRIEYLSGGGPSSPMSPSRNASNNAHKFSLSLLDQSLDTKLNRSDEKGDYQHVNPTMNSHLKKISSLRRSSSFEMDSNFISHNPSKKSSPKSLSPSSERKKSSRDVMAGWLAASYNESPDDLRDAQLVNAFLRGTVRRFDAELNATSELRRQQVQDGELSILLSGDGMSGRQTLITPTDLVALILSPDFELRIVGSQADRDVYVRVDMHKRDSLRRKFSSGNDIHYAREILDQNFGRYLSGSVYLSLEELCLPDNIRDRLMLMEYSYRAKLSLSQRDEVVHVASSINSSINLWKRQLHKLHDDDEMEIRASLKNVELARKIFDKSTSKKALTFINKTRNSASDAKAEEAHMRSYLEDMGSSQEFKEELCERVRSGGIRCRNLRQTLQYFIQSVRQWRMQRQIRLARMRAASGEKQLVADGTNLIFAPPVVIQPQISLNFGPNTADQSSLIGPDSAISNNFQTNHSRSDQNRLPNYSISNSGASRELKLKSPSKPLSPLNRPIDTDSPRTKAYKQMISVAASSIPPHLQLLKTRMASSRLCVKSIGRDLRKKLIQQWAHETASSGVTRPSDAPAMEEIKHFKKSSGTSSVQDLNSSGKFSLSHQATNNNQTASNKLLSRPASSKTIIPNDAASKFNAKIDAIMERKRSLLPPEIKKILGPAPKFIESINSSEIKLKDGSFDAVQKSSNCLPILRPHHGLWTREEIQNSINDPHKTTICGSLMSRSHQCEIGPIDIEFQAEERRWKARTQRLERQGRAAENRLTDHSAVRTASSNINNDNNNNSKKNMRADKSLLSVTNASKDSVRTAGETSLVLANQQLSSRFAHRTSPNSNSGVVTSRIVNKRQNLSEDLRRLAAGDVDAFRTFEETPEEAAVYISATKMSFARGDAGGGAGLSSRGFRSAANSAVGVSELSYHGHHHHHNGDLHISGAFTSVSHNNAHDRSNAGAPNSSSIKSVAIAGVSQGIPGNIDDLCNLGEEDTQHILGFIKQSKYVSVQAKVFNGKFRTNRIKLSNPDVIVSISREFGGLRKLSEIEADSLVRNSHLWWLSRKEEVIARINALISDDAFTGGY